MKIAVLMSTYNGHNFLDKQLESLANQTVAKIMTVYIRDDGSSDDTFKIISKWMNQMNIVLYKESNAGPSMSFWKLLMNTDIQADFYAFCDQDDIWDSDKLEVAIKQLNRNAHLYAFNCRIIDENGKVITKERLTSKPLIELRRLFISGFTQGCSMVFDDQLRRYMQHLELRCVPMHDIVLMLYALNFGTIYWDQNTHFGYRVHSSNVVAKGNKTGIQKLKTILWNWKNSSKNSMSIVADELIANAKKLKKEDVEYLACVRDYKRNAVSKWKIMTVSGMSGVGKEAMRSYKIRVLLNLL